MFDNLFGGLFDFNRDGETDSIEAGIGFAIMQDLTLTPPDDDPQLVFESLNSTGMDLNEGDKIRNYVLTLL